MIETTGKQINFNYCMDLGSFLGRPTPAIDVTVGGHEQR